MVKSFFIYGREILVSLPLSIIKAWKYFGWRGAWLIWNDLVFTRILIPVSVPGFGPLCKRNEARSLADNFCLGELRCEEVEQALKSHAAPAVVDLGVNLGMSIRWWFHQNAKARVTGVDMMQEALDYTTTRLQQSHLGVDWRPVCCAVAEADGLPITIQFSDPLDGETSVSSSQGGQTREVAVRCLDSIPTPDEILLLKCDIEGYGGHALAGGRKTLRKSRYVVTETHGEAEMEKMSRVLFEEGFVPFMLSSRSLWWRRLTVT